MKVYYDSSLTGSGKTHSAIDYYVKSERKVLAVVPSIDLAREYEKKAYELAKDKCNPFFCKVITSEDKKTGKGKGRPVKQMVQDAIDGANKKEFPVFLVITHITFKSLMLDGMRGVDGWCLLIDECIDLFSTASMSLTKLSATNFHDKFYWKKSCFSGLMTVGVKEEYKNVLISLLDGEIKDDGWWGREDALQFLEYVLSSSFITYLVEDDFCALQRVMKGHDEGVKLYFLSAVDKVSLSKFSSISILSAMFEKTVLCEVLRSTGMQCEFYNFSGGSSSSHDNGDRLKIHYFIDKNNSISFMSKGGEKGDDNEAKVVRTALSIIGDEDFIFNANVESRKKKAYKTLLEKDGQGIGQKVELVTAVAGVNLYSAYCNALYMTSRNIDPKEKTILARFGISEEFANEDRNLLAAYQFVSRTSIRDKSSDSDVNFYVVDKRTAKFLNVLWPDSEIIKHDVIGLTEGRRKTKNLPPNSSKEYRFLRDVINGYEKKGRRDFMDHVPGKFVGICHKYNADVNREVYNYMKSKAKACKKCGTLYCVGC